MKPTLVPIILLGLMALTGCTITRRAAVPEVGHYYISPTVEFATIGKVVVFELDNCSSDVQLARTLTETITNSLEKRHLFSLNILMRSDPQFRSLGLEDMSSYSSDKLSAMRRELNADAILFGSITQYSPYPHLMTGLHLRMVDLRDGQLVWAMEQTWDSTDNRLEQRMREFFDSQMRSGYEPMNWQLLVTSPRAFNKFVSFEVARTFPVRRNYMNIPVSSEKNADFSIKSKIFGKTYQVPQKTLKFAEKLTKIGM